MNNEVGIFSKIVSSKICLVYGMAGEVARAEKMAERSTFLSLPPKSLSPLVSLPQNRSRHHQVQGHHYHHRHKFYHRHHHHHHRHLHFLLRH